MIKNCIKFNKLLLSPEDKIANCVETQKLDFHLMFFLKDLISPKVIYFCAINLFFDELKLVFKCSVKNKFNNIFSKRQLSANQQNFSSQIPQNSMTSNLSIS